MYSEDENFDEEIDGDDGRSKKNSGNALMDFYNSNKKLVWIVGGLLLVLLLLSMAKGCSGSPNGGFNGNKPKLTISSNSESLSVGNSTRLIVTIKNADDAFIVWSSSDENVATVDQLGNVNAISLGTATITALYKHPDNNEYKATCEITVSEGSQNVSITNASFPEGEVLITMGDEYQLLKQITPSNGYVTKIAYTSSNTSVVSVDSNGKIKGLSEGKATIKMSVNDDMFTDEIVVNVVMDNVDPQLIINPTAISFSSNMASVAVGQTQQLTYRVLPYGAYVEDLIWTSSDETIASVDEDGVILGVKAGTAIITVTTRNEKSATIAVEVKESDVPVTSIGLSSSQNITLNVNETATIIPNVQPSNATNKAVTYQSNNKSVAIVNESGVVTAVSSGTATITVTTVDQGKTINVTVTVNSNSSTGGNNNTGGGNNNTGGGNTNSCSKDQVIQISSDSGGAITPSSTSGNSVTVTKSAVTVNTNGINGDLCGGLRSLRYCIKDSYTGSDCTSYTQFNKGDSITLNVPSGSGVMQLIIQAETEKGDFVKRYYMKYNRSNSSNNSTGGTTNNNTNNNNNNTSSTQKCYCCGGSQGCNYTWGTGGSSCAYQSGMSKESCIGNSSKFKTTTMSLTKDTTSSSYGTYKSYKFSVYGNRIISNFYYCVAGGSSCIINKSSAKTPIIRNNYTCYSGDVGSTYKVSNSSYSYQHLVCASSEQTMCFGVADSAGNMATLGCWKF